MKQISLEVAERQNKGTRENNRLRTSGRIPCIVYHRGEESIPGSLDGKQFVLSAQQVKSSQIFILKSSHPGLNGKSALVKEIQKDFVRGKINHVDLQALREDEEVTVRVGLQIVGEAAGVKLDGGILTVSGHDLQVSCLPSKIPEVIVVNVSELRLGHSIHAGEVALPEGVKLIDNPEETVVSVVAAKVEEVAVEAAPAEGAAVEGAEGAAAPGAEGAPAAGAQAGAAKAPEEGKKGGKGEK